MVHLGYFFFFDTGLEIYLLWLMKSQQLPKRKVGSPSPFIVPHNLAVIMASKVHSWNQRQENKEEDANKITVCSLSNKTL